MVKPDRCPMHVKCCEECRHWEPVPFHDRGGFCSLKGERPAHWQLVPEPQKVPAKAARDDRRVAFRVGS